MLKRLFDVVRIRKASRRRLHESCWQAAETMEVRLLLTTLPTHLESDIQAYQLWTDATKATLGLIGNYVDQSLRERAIQDDWRVSQTISGTRTDVSIDFQTASWGDPSKVGITNATPSNWDFFSVQWDGYIEVPAGGVSVWTNSDDGSRLWVDLNNDGVFNSSGPEFANNNWGSGQLATNGTPTPVIAAGLYRIRIQYEDQVGGSDITLKSGPQNRLRVAYLIPANREPQPEGEANLRSLVTNYQTWLADQMDRQGFGRKTFQFETEADGVTPRIHTLRLPGDDTEYAATDGGETYNRVMAGAGEVGINTLADGEIWLIVHEAFIQIADGSHIGGVALGGGGSALLSGASLSLLDLQGLQDNRNYAGLVIPTYGSRPLIQGKSFADFEGTTISSVASSAAGAYMHELMHAFWLTKHDGRNDNNFHGNLMGNGLRGWRGYMFPNQYPDDTVSLQRSTAIALNSSRFFQPIQAYTDNTAPVVQLNGLPSVVNGKVRIQYTATDNQQLAAAILIRDGESREEMALTGVNASVAFETPYFELQKNSDYEIFVYDTSGNSSSTTFQYTVTASSNYAPQPSIRASRELAVVGQELTLSATSSTDLNSAQGLQVEWDTDGNGTFDTVPSTNLTLKVSYSSVGSRLVRARVRDTQGAMAVSEVIPIRIVTKLDSTLAPQVTATTMSDGTPRLNWTAVSGATEYDVWISPSPGSAAYRVQRVSGTSYAPWELGIGKYNVWVRATNGASMSAWSPVVTLQDRTAPVFKHVATTQDTLRPTVEWKSVAGAASYDVWIDDVTRGISQKVRDTNVTGTSFTPSIDLPVGAYRVWVRAQPASGIPGLWSLHAQFQTKPAPVVLSGFGSTFDRTPTFTWGSVAGAVKYEFFLRNLATGATTLYEKNLTATSFTPSSNLADGSYRWWAIAVSQAGIRTLWSAPADLSVSDGRTSLLTPTGTASSSKPVFTWRVVAAAARYDLYVDRIGGPSQVIRQQNLTQATYTPTTSLSAGSYRAWVRAISTSGELGPWSLPLDFNV